MEKLEWCRYPMVKKFRRYVYSFDVIHERDRQTDRRTPGGSKDRTYASHRAVKTVLQGGHHEQVTKFQQKIFFKQL